MPENIIDENEVHLYQYDMDVTTVSMLRKFLTIISREEILKINRYIRIKDKNRFITSTAILRIILGYYLGIEPNLIKFAKNNFGKPFIQNNSIYFNISHSKNILVIAVANTNIGIDIEYKNINFQFEDLLDFVLSNNEKLIVKNLPYDLKILKFFQYWVQKESILKLIGVGLNFDLTKIELKNNKFQFKNKYFISRGLVEEPPKVSF